MTKLFERLKQIIQPRPRPAGPGGPGPRRRDPQFVGRMNLKDIEQAPEGRAQEMAGHAPERVDT